jgi:CRISPR-associated endonuclease/helicase Cas3
LWHDLGKFQPEFQRRLQGEKVSVEHSGAGAAHAMAAHQSGALPLAFVIAGHHAGLANLIKSSPGNPTPLTERLALNEALARRLSAAVPDSILSHPLPSLPPFLDPILGQHEQKNRVEFWIRFLFSALTDADYLDTEHALDPHRSGLRPQPLDPGTLLPLIETAIAKKRIDAPLTELQNARNEVADACRAAADMPPGLFSLTAPTGTGKTLASMLFALRHAALQGLRRVIVVLPYTSIIEQNAAAYRDVFGEKTVLEHHTNLDPDKELSRKGEELTAEHRLASENWDAPIIVTTTVQFFESLFANRTSRCRKLHNIARSVVILDEVQSLPPNFLVTILDALKQLTAHYGCTIALSTATPPSLVARANFSYGLPQVTEIIPDPAALARTLRRVTYHWPQTPEPSGWEEVAALMAGHPRSLAVVHLRNDARILTGILRSLKPDEPVYHLSASMCAAHRSNVLADVRLQLKSGDPCRLVSTQLIEAGVEIDFPVLFRAMAGLDSIVQAAGRCNREGNLPSGAVHIFNAPTQPPPGVLRRGLETMRALLAAKGADADISDPDTCIEYFRAFYSVTLRDTLGIQAERAELNFATVAEMFHLIEDECTASIVVKYGDSEDRLKSLERAGPSRATLRRLQPFIVQIYPNALHRLTAAGALDEVFPGVFRLLDPFHHIYDEDFGLDLKGVISPDVGSMII